MRRSVAAPLLISLSLLSCQDQDRGPVGPDGGLPAFAISDAVHGGGNEHFYFLPPLVPSTAFGGVTDPTLSPSAIVCEWDGAACVDVVAAFDMQAGSGAEVIRYDASSQHYIVNWHTDECVTGRCTLDPAKTYRLRVLAGATLLGFADVDVVSNGSQLRNVQTSQYIGLVNGRTLPVKFRIEQGAVQLVEEGVPATVGSEGGELASPDGSVAMTIPEGALTADVGITIEPAPELPTAGDFAVPVNLGPDGQSFAEPLTLTLAFDPERLPEGIAPTDVAMVTWVDDHWEEVPGAYLSEVDNTISAEITHFSYYAVNIWPNYVSGPSTTTLFQGQTTTVGGWAAYFQTFPRTVCYRVNWFRRTCYTYVDTRAYPLSGVAIRFVSSNATVLSVAAPAYSVTAQSGNAVSPPITALTLGTATITGSSSLGGQTYSSAIPMTVTTPPAINPTPQGRSQSLIQVLPGATGSVTVPIGNSGGYRLTNLQLVGPPRNCFTGSEYTWLSHSFAATEAPTSLTLTATPPADTPLGLYDMCFTLRGAFAPDYAYGVVVSVQEVIVSPSPFINPFPQGGTQNVIEAPAGLETTKDVPIGNSGGSTLSGLIMTPVSGCYDGQPVSWLSHRWQSTTAPTTLSLTASPPADLPPGTYDLCFQLQARSAGAPDRPYGARVIVTTPPAPPPPLPPGAQVAAGGKSTCARTVDGVVYCWGESTHGATTPPGDEFADIQGGFFHYCGIREDSTVGCWGYNSDLRATPPSGSFVQLSVAPESNCALRRDGTPACWGFSGDGRISPPAGSYKQIGLGWYHGCGIRTDDTLVCWGQNRDGETVPPSGTFRKVIGGVYTTCAVRMNYTLTCWGAMTTAPTGYFTDIGTNISGGHMCAIRFDRSIACWGENTFGQATPPAGQFAQVSGGQFHSCAVETSQSIRCWGSNATGATGVVPPPPPPLPGWTIASSMRTPRFGMAAAVVNDIIYTIGGNAHPGEPYPGGPTTNIVEAFDVALGVWSTRRSAPAPREYSMAAVHDGKIYVFGGWTANLSSDRRTFVYDPASDSWSQSLDAPFPLHGGIAAEIDGSIYVTTSSCCGTPTAGFLRFDPSSSTWTRLPDMPRGHSFPAGGGTIGGKLYIAGGYEAGSGLDVFDPLTGSWSSKRAMPVAVQHASSLVHRGKLYVFGGNLATGASQTGVYAYDPSSDTWSSVTSIPRPRGLPSAVAVGGRAYILGGNGPPSPYSPIGIVDSWVLPDDWGLITPTFSVEYVGSLGSGTGEARTLNNSGRIVGASDGAAFYIDDGDAAPTRIPNPFGDIYWANDVNEAGIIVVSNPYQGWGWDPDTGAMTGPPPGPFTQNNRRLAVSLNDAGLMLASADNGAFAQNYVWRVGTSETTLIPSAYNVGSGIINDAGIAIVSADPGAGGTSRLWNQNTLSATVIPSLGGVTLGQDLNASSVAVGESQVGGQPHAFRFDPATGVTRDLGTLGGTQSRAVGINDQGYIVGWSLNAAGRKRGFLWDPVHQRMWALPPLPGHDETAAHDINEHGVIVGYSAAAGQKRAVKWILN